MIRQRDMLAFLLKEMCKMIDWSEAPDWANYAAMDKDGMWHWYECEPSPRSIDWCCIGKFKPISNYRNWINSVTSRTSKEQK